MTTVLTFLNALIAIPKIGETVMAFIAQIVGWYVQKQNSDTLRSIADAAALGARANTQEERYAAAEAWQRALSRSRVFPS